MVACWFFRSRRGASCLCPPRTKGQHRQSPESPERSILERTREVSSFCPVAPLGRRYSTRSAGGLQLFCPCCFVRVWALPVLFRLFSLAASASRVLRSGSPDLGRSCQMPARAARKRKAPPSLTMWHGSVARTKQL